MPLLICVVLLVMPSRRLDTQFATVTRIARTIPSLIIDSSEKRALPILKATPSNAACTGPSQPSRYSATTLQTNRLITPSHARIAGLGVKLLRKIYMDTRTTARDSDSGITISSNGVWIL